MTMSYHLGTSLSSRQSKKKKFFWLILIVLVLFFYSKVIVFSQEVFKALAYPIWVAETTLDEKTLNPFGFLVSKKKLLLENEQLIQDINEAEMMLADRNLLLKENIELKEIMGRREDDNLILASVLSKPNNSLYDSFVIDAGKDFNLSIGDKVFAFGNILIGEISEVDGTTSKVKLYSSPGEQISVLVGLFNVEGTAVGRGAGNFEIILPRDTDIGLGEPVSIAGMRSSVLGSIEYVTENPIDSFKGFLFKSPVNLFELKWVQILK